MFKLRLLFVPGGDAGCACALGACRLLGNRVREEPVLFYKGAGTHNDCCPRRTLGDWELKWKRICICCVWPRRRNFSPREGAFCRFFRV